MHSVWVEPADPEGMMAMFEARCTCGWRGESTPEESEADDDCRKHRRETYAPTLDDLAWMSGTGRWAQ